MKTVIRILNMVNDMWFSFRELLTISFKSLFLSVPATLQHDPDNRDIFKRQHSQQHFQNVALFRIMYNVGHNDHVSPFNLISYAKIKCRFSSFFPF